MPIDLVTASARGKRERLMSYEEASRQGEALILSAIQYGGWDRLPEQLSALRAVMRDQVKRGVFA